MDFEEIKNYLEGRTNESDTVKIRNWLKDSMNDSESRKILGEIWANSNIHLTEKKPDFDLMLNQVHHQINSHKPQLKVHVPNSDNSSLGFFEIFSKVAAILILPLFILSLYFYNHPKQNVNQLTFNTVDAVREVYTKPGTRTKINLPDGTDVWLNDGTTLRYPEKFTGNNREVFVDGEAYFEVKSDLQNPFVVNNPMMTTVVTGTHFNLNAYTADNYFEVTLLEGKVNLKKNNHNFMMKPGQQVQFDTQLEKMINKNVDPENAAAWINGKLIFKDEKVGIAIKKLSRWYNVDIVLTNPELAGYLFTGTFQDEKLDQTLKLVSLALPVKFEFKKEKDQSKLQRTIYMKKN